MAGEDFTHEELPLLSVSLGRLQNYVMGALVEEALPNLHAAAGVAHDHTASQQIDAVWEVTRVLFSKWRGTEKAVAAESFSAERLM